MSSSSSISLIPASAPRAQSSSSARAPRTASSSPPPRARPRKPPHRPRSRLRLVGRINVSPSPAPDAPALVPSPVDWVDYGCPLPGLDIEIDSDCSDVREETVVLNPHAARAPAASSKSLLRLLHVTTPPPLPQPLSSPQHRKSPTASPVTPHTSAATPNTSTPPSPLTPTELVAAQKQLRAEAALLLDDVVCDVRGRPSTTCERVLPCGDIFCWACFASCLGAVSMARGTSTCGACTAPVGSFEPVAAQTFVPVRTGVPVMRKGVTPATAAAAAGQDVFGPVVPGQAAVIRIDNVASDVEESIVESFLPPHSLPPDHPHPIHILLDRYDGRTKDYKVTPDAARRLLRTRQNTLMPSRAVTGGRNRPVTISQVSPAELTAERRPGSKAELAALLDLCEAVLFTHPPPPAHSHTSQHRMGAATSTTGRAHYVKHRHAPFGAVLSILTKLAGPHSPA
ncbi:hypothetical protein Q5752_003332 [Cryptotrichosporon argae]